MKFFLTIFSVIFGLQLATSQTTTPLDTFRRSAGIDATFINNFLPFNNTIGTRGKYLFHFIRYEENNRLSRHAFDIDVFGNFEDNESDIDRDDAVFNIDYKYSKGKRKKRFIPISFQNSMPIFA